MSRLVLIAAAAPSLTCRPNFPYGIPQETVTDNREYIRPAANAEKFWRQIFLQHTSQAFSDWFLIGLQAAGWATAAIAKT